MTILSMVMPSFSQDLPRSSWDKRGEPLFRSDDGGELKEEKEEEQKKDMKKEEEEEEEEACETCSDVSDSETEEKDAKVSGWGMSEWGPLYEKIYPCKLKEATLKVKC